MTPERRHIPFSSAIGVDTYDNPMRRVLEASMGIRFPDADSTTAIRVMRISDHPLRVHEFPSYSEAHHNRLVATAKIGTAAITLNAYRDALLSPDKLTTTACADFRILPVLEGRDGPHVRIESSMVNTESYDRKASTISIDTVHEIMGVPDSLEMADPLSFVFEEKDYIMPLAQLGITIDRQRSTKQAWRMWRQVKSHQEQNVVQLAIRDQTLPASLLRLLKSQGIHSCDFRYLGKLMAIHKNAALAEAGYDDIIQMLQPSVKARILHEGSRSLHYRTASDLAERITDLYHTAFSNVYNKEQIHIPVR